MIAHWLRATRMNNTAHRAHIDNFSVKIFGYISTIRFDDDLFLALHGNEDEPSLTTEQSLEWRVWSIFDIFYKKQLSVHNTAVTQRDFLAFVTIPENNTLGSSLTRTARTVSKSLCPGRLWQIYLGNTIKHFKHTQSFHSAPIVFSV
jgi:hypothetical protein